jgi:hypothetical protein
MLIILPYDIRKCFNYKTKQLSQYYFIVVPKFIDGKL